MPREDKPSRIPIAIAAAALAALVAAVFYPIVGYEFVDLDVPQQVIENPHIRGLTVENLKHIFTSRCVSSYYPVRTLSYAVDYQLWGLNAGGFKLTNALVHLVNVLLVFWLALRLSCPSAAERTGGKVAAAAVAAGVFAVHPVVVEPVAWVAGREELLMTLGALACVHFHISARRHSPEGAISAKGLAFSACALVSCAAACLSNAVGAVVPLIVTAWDALVLPKPTPWRIVRGTAALWAVALATIVVKAAGDSLRDYNHAGLFAAERWRVVLNVYWLNLATLVWPTGLAPQRPGVSPQSFFDIEVVLGGAAILATAWGLWRLRRQRTALFAVLWFGLALGPVSQVMPHHVQRADRFLYLPLAGLVAAAALGLDRLGSRASRAMRGGLALGAAAVVLALAVAGSVQVRTWRDAVAMWENCVRLDPAGTIANCALADNLAKQGQWTGAMLHYERSLATAPNAVAILDRFARALAACPVPALRDDRRAVEMAQRAFAQDPKCLRTLSAVRTRRALGLAEDRRFDEALREYRAVLDLHPHYPPALLGTAWLLAASGREGPRDPEKAVELARRACRDAEGAGPEGRYILAVACASAGRFDEAAATAESALQQAEAAGDDELIADLRALHAACRRRTPCSDPAGRPLKRIVERAIPR